MNNENATYLSELIFSQLASFRSVQLPGIGCLRCTLINATADKQTKKLSPPRYVVEFYGEGNDKSIVELLSENSNQSEEEALALYEEWKRLVCVVSETGETYEIPKVGTLTVSETNPALFVPAKELEPYTNPFGSNEEIRITVPATIVKPTPIRRIDKRSNTKRVMIALLIAAIGILSFVWVQIYSFRNHRIDKKEATVVLQPAFPATTDTLMSEPADTTTTESVVVAIDEPSKPFHVIAGTFADSAKAERLLIELKETGNGGVTTFKTRNSISPYFVSIAAFATQDEATAYINNADPANKKEFWVHKKREE